MPSRPVGLTRDLPPGRVMHAEVEGADLVVWRAGSGEIAAWDNRCPHRGMALSHGFVRGNALACLYHGWHYERSGRCSHIPAHPDLEPPATIHAVQHGVTETDGVIWVSVDGDGEGEATGLAPLRSLLVDAPPEAVEAAREGTPLPEDAGPERPVTLLNPLADGSTMVTLLTAPGLPLARLRALSRWAEAMRRRAETAPEEGRA